MKLGDWVLLEFDVDTYEAREVTCHWTHRSHGTCWKRCRMKISVNEINENKASGASVVETLEMSQKPVVRPIERISAHTQALTFELWSPTMLKKVLESSK